MDYRDALKYILYRTDYERGPRPPYKERYYRLDRVEELMSALGNPQRSFDAVHIAGTKGKGSTTAMIEAVLRQAGYRTGMYTSPHLHTFRERMRVNGTYISEQQLVELTLELSRVLNDRPEVTVFESITALAFTFMAKQNVQIAAVEVGLGGRLDATNVLAPLTSVITSVSMDHVNILGSTLEQIAAEKAGIIKANTPVVVAPQKSKARQVISVKATELTAPLVQVGDDWHYEAVDASLTGQIINVHRLNEVPYKNLFLSLVGEHQAENATVALAALETIREKYPFSEGDVRQGFESLVWPGRFELLSRDPLLIMDGAHNPYSCQRLIETIHQLAPQKRVHLVFGSSMGHQVEGLLSVLAPHAENIHLVHAPHVRAVALDVLETTLASMDKRVASEGSVAEGLENAMAQADKDDVVLVTGSLFVVAEARKVWLEARGIIVEQDPPGVY